VNPQPYSAFLDRKSQLGGEHGFTPTWMPSALFDFQTALVEWAIRHARGALLADCGLGKTPMQLVWAENVARHTKGRVLILTPLAVAHQTIGEGEKFGVECSRDPAARIAVANYERLHHYTPSDFQGVVCDESSILKSFDGSTRLAVTQFLRKVPHRLLCTATAAPNDFTEMGTSSEALGYLGHMDMLARFFKTDTNMKSRGNGGRVYGQVVKWRFKGHAEGPFWRWVASWARAMRKPSDLGFQDAAFVLPRLEERQHIVESRTAPDGMLFTLPAVSLQEQREERRRTITERCEKLAALVATKEPALVWCHLNDEGDLLEQLIPDAVQVSGDDSDDAKEEKFLAFGKGKVRVLVTKPKIGAWGLNFQHCAHVAMFPSHSYEQYYQGIRRCWRFGQTRPVVVDIVTTEGETRVLANLQRKAAQADAMFTQLVAAMRQALAVARGTYGTEPEELPAWL
jgi:helicase-like protein